MPKVRISKAQTGGPSHQWSDDDPNIGNKAVGYKDYGDMYTTNRWPGLLEKPVNTQSWGMGNPANLIPGNYAGFSGAPANNIISNQVLPVHQTIQPQNTNSHTDENANYSVDSVRKFGGSTRKVRITQTPEMAYGGRTSSKVVDQNNFDSRWNPGTYQGQIGVNPDPDPYARTGNTLPEAHPDDANVNAEKQEQILGNFTPDGLPSLMNVDGPPHTQGGKDINVPDGAFIFSDTKSLKIKDPEVLKQFGQTKAMTPAGIAKNYQLQKFTKVLADPKSDPVSKKTAELMVGNYTDKLNQLAGVQEGIKQRLGLDNDSKNQVPRQSFQMGGMYDVHPDMAKQLASQGYEFEVVN